MAPSGAGRGQLSRDERVQLFGIDCADDVVWKDWQPGIETVHELVLQNVALVTQKLKVKLPQTKEFDMPYPEAFRLAPGMSKSIPISFRPSQYQPHVDAVEICTKEGSFKVSVKAVVKDIALSVPQFVDFGLCPTCEKSEVRVEVMNVGTLPAAIRWHAKSPYFVKCPSQVLEVGQAMQCTVEFVPPTASVFDAVLTCEASRLQSIDNTSPASIDMDSSAAYRSHATKMEEGKGTKRYPMSITGVGKIPHLAVANVSKPHVDFGAVFPGNRVTQTLQIQNVTPVLAEFKVRALDDQVSPVPPPSFAVFPDSGRVEPQGSCTLTFSFLSHTIKEQACQRFEITTPGGTPLIIACTAFCQPMDVRLSARSINFGEVHCGSVYTRTVQLHNSSARPAPYHFMNMDRAQGIFWVDRYIGVIPPESFMVITVSFGPLLPINYLKQVYIVVKGAVKPLTLDLLGSAFSEKARPAGLKQQHVDNFRSLQLSGVREFPRSSAPSPEDGTMELVNSEDEDEDVARDEQTLKLQPKQLSATATFLEMMLPTESKFRDIAISPASLNYGMCSTAATSEKQVVTINNRSSSKVTVAWMMPGETRMPCIPEEKSRFTVFPQQCDIKPNSQAEFTLSFRAQSESSYEGEMLEAVVYHKVNRNFRLVDNDSFTPPWMVAVRGQGHTMGGTRNDPRLDISEASVRFRGCYPGERRYQVSMLTNPGDTQVSYHFLPPVDATTGDTPLQNLTDLQGDVPFRVFPADGVIPPHQFHLIVVEFAPLAARNEAAYVATFPIIVDYNEKRPISFRAIGRCWEPRISLCRAQRTVTFPPTCSGIESMMKCEVKNMSEVPVAFTCKIPARYQAWFNFPNPSGVLMPLETTVVPARFCPGSDTTFSAPVYVLARGIEDPDGVVEGPLKALTSPEALDKVMDVAPSYALLFVGHGKGPALSVEPQDLELSAVRACDEVRQSVTVVNSSHIAVHFSVHAEFVECSSGSVPKAVGEAALQLDHATGSVAGRCTDSLTFTFRPPARGVYEYKILISPFGDDPDDASSPTGKRTTVLSVRADVQCPTIRIVDLRTESPTLQPQSMMWNQFQVDGINALFDGEVAPAERGFQAATGIDEKKKWVGKLKPFQLLFGTSAAGSNPTVVYVVLLNPSRLKVRFSFQTPKNLNLEHPPYWCDEKSMVDEREAHFSWVEEHKLFEIQPRMGEILPGDFLYVQMKYNHHSIGTHVLPVVFNVIDGHSVLFYLKAHSVAPNVGCLSVRSSVVKLQPVPIHVGRGPRQVVELTNNGGYQAHWCIDDAKIREQIADNFNYEILQVEPREGRLEPQTSTFLHVTFTPLEARSYQLPVRVEMLRDGRAAEELCFELHSEGYHPNDPNPSLSTSTVFQPTLPIQTYAPVPGCGAALSIELLDFGACPLRSEVSRMLVLVNYSHDFVLSYTWDHCGLFQSDTDFRIEPSCGELSPGSHCIVVFRMCSAESVDISAEIVCHLEWTHLSLYGQDGFIDAAESSGPQVEYLAYHCDHIHEQIKTGKAFLGSKDKKHIAVASRLTISRFRNLMSSAAGQKFLNQNLHRTALLATHLPVHSPKPGMHSSGLHTPSSSRHGGAVVDVSTSSFQSQAAAAAAMGPPPPSSYPLYVRVRAVVADWAVPETQADEFIVSTPAAPLAKSLGVGIGQGLVPDVGGSASGSHAALDAGTMPAKIMEHMLREIMAEDDVQSVLNGMLLSKDLPYFIQFDDSNPPGYVERVRALVVEEPEAPKLEALPMSHQSTRVTASRDSAGKDEEAAIAEAEVQAPVERVTAANPRVMLDFRAPDLQPAVLNMPVLPPEGSQGDLAVGMHDVSSSSSARGPGSVKDSLAVLPQMTPSASRGVISRSASMEPGPEQQALLSPEFQMQSMQSQSSPTGAGAAQAAASSEACRATWEEVQQNYGQVDLDAFKMAAAEVLDGMLLDLMDEVVGGQLNWMRPMHRSRARKSARPGPFPADQQRL